MTSAGPRCGGGGAGRQGWPDEGTFHSLRHYFATRLITSGADPTDVQNALRHSSLRITLETYVHWWPKKDRRRNIISGALREASAKRNRGPKAPDSR
ncbi:tyrosine-type recombinase/integrase [Micromonospora chalcea]